jgi:hypothetical protein
VRLFALSLALATGCSNDLPPPIGDSDAAPEYADSFSPAVPVDASGDGGSTYNLDFDGVCKSGYVPVWHFFDFETHTPMNSSLDFSASSATSLGALGSTPSVHLATVTGADITTWTGVDVDPKLQSIGQMSHTYLRVVVVETPATDGTPSVLVHYRQAFDCIGQ